MDDEATEFWSKFEEETGEKVEARSMGERFQPTAGDVGVWGLLVLTDKSFRFKYMPSDSWLSSLFKKAGRSAEPKRDLDVVIPRADIVSVEAPRGGFLSRLFAPAFPHFTIVSRAEGAEKRLAFSADPGSGLLAAVIKAAGSKGDGS
jgi:hypothetical protein